MASGANAAIYYVPEAYSTAGPRLMGRNAAGESFLRGWSAYAKVDRFFCCIEDQRVVPDFEAAVRRHRPDAPVRGILKGDLGGLAEPGALFMPGPGLADLGWRRTLIGQDMGWSHVGVTHTTATAAVMDELAAFYAAPVQPWDALICTSTSVLATVEAVLDAQREHLMRRLGATTFVRPQLPVIPLGIHTADFAFAAAERAAARAALGADEQTIVVLFAGRLSFHAKAHPLAMYQALERTAATLPAGHKLMLVECGWHANAAIKQSFEDAQRLACPSIATRLLDGREAGPRRTAWAAADIFCSLSDNIQETFGLVPIEAMAAGLPTVVSDWNGYRDTVRDGIDGFRVPTYAPPPHVSPDMSLQLEFERYDLYCSQACMMVAVDVDAAAEAFIRLCRDPALRRRMGEAGRERARRAFDWSRIIPTYQELMAELQAIRLEAKARGGPAGAVCSPWPARMDPFAAFASYPTRTIGATTMVALGDRRSVSKIHDLHRLAMVAHGSLTYLAPAEVEAIVGNVSGGAKPAADVVAALPVARQPSALRALLRLLKLGVLRVAG